jgi:hypothetical protein
MGGSFADRPDRSHRHADRASAETHALHASVVQHFEAKASADPEDGERDLRANLHWLHVRHGLSRHDAKTPQISKIRSV